MTDQSVKLSKMTQSDLDACGELVGQLELFRRYSFGSDAACRLLGRALDDGRSVLLVARDEPKVLGFAWLVPRGGFDRSGYLRLIAVAPEAHGRGVGRLLMSALERDHLQPGGIVVLASEQNPAAHRFYEALGYRAVGCLPAYVRADQDERIYYKPPG